MVDYGGLFFDDMLPSHQFAPGDHRGFRPPGWVQEGRRRMDAMRPIAQRTGLTMLQLGCQWNLDHEAVACVVPTLIQETGPRARPVEDKRAELAALPLESRLSPEDVETIRELGDNTGCMALKGATPDHSGERAPGPLVAGRAARAGRPTLADRARARSSSNHVTAGAHARASSYRFISARTHSQPAERSSTPIAAATFSHIP